MFLVFNKKKINSYLISLGTVAILFGISIMATNNITNTIETSGQITEFPINKVETERKAVAISINCSENVENIDSILDSLSKMKAKATFYITGEIASNYPDAVKKIISNGNEVGNLSDEYCHLNQKSVIDSLDYNGLNGEEMWKKISENLTSGSIILMHNSAKYTSSSLEYIIYNIQEKGYELTTVSNLVGINN